MADPIHRTSSLQPVVQPAVAVDVVVLQIEFGDAWRGQRHPVLGAVPVDQHELAHPVDLSPDLLEIPALDRLQGAAPQVEYAVGDSIPAAPGDEVHRLVVILPL